MSPIAFLEFPFLRDQLFISFFKSLTYESSLSTYEEFIFKAQVEYYRKFINPNFDATSLISIPIPSKCPYASKLNLPVSSTLAIEQISLLRYFCLENFHISDMNLPGLTVNICKPLGKMAESCPFYLFTSGNHDHFNFLSTNIISSDASFSKLPEIDSNPLYNEIIKVKPVLSPSDVLYFFPLNTLIINPHDLDKVLNIFVYLNLSGATDISLKKLKALGIGAKAIKPSQFQAYTDILTVEYIRKNFKLFQ